VTTVQLWTGRETWTLRASSGKWRSASTRSSRTSAALRSPNCAGAGSSPAASPPSRRPAPETSRRGGHSRYTPDSAAHLKPEHVAGAARPWPSVESRWCAPTVQEAPTPSAIRPWTPQHDDPQRYKMTHPWTKQNGPSSREFAASGPFSQRVAGDGFEPTWAEPNARSLRGCSCLVGGGFVLVTGLPGGCARGGDGDGAVDALW
jgi:hypothetical protein